MDVYTTLDIGATANGPSLQLVRRLLLNVEPTKKVVKVENGNHSESLRKVTDVPVMF